MTGTNYQGRIEREKSFSLLCQDPEMCRRLIINSKASFSVNGFGMSFVAYLKKMIMSREAGTQLKAVKCIIVTLIGSKHKDNSVTPEEGNFIVKKLLDNDFVEFLCEALPYPSTPTSSDLLLAIYQCLALLSSNDEFFHFHAVYALDSVLRSLYFVSQCALGNEKSDLGKQNHTLSSGLSLIALILHGSINKCNILSSSNKTVEGGSLLERINKLISATIKLSNLHIKWKSGLVLRSLLSPWHLGKYFNWENENVIESISKKSVCISKNICTGDDEKQNHKEFKRRIPLFNGKVHMIQRRSTLEESEIHICNNNYSGNSSPNPFPCKELKLIVGLFEETMKALQTCLKGAVISDCCIKPTVTNRFFLLVCQIGKNILQLLPQKITLLNEKGKDEMSRMEPSLMKEYQQIFHILCQPIGEICANILVTYDTTISDFMLLNVSCNSTLFHKLKNGLMTQHCLFSKNFFILSDSVKKGLELECKKGNCELYKEYLTCLEWMYLKFGKFCKEISHKLAFQGYLTLLPLLLSSQDFRNEAIINTSLVVLAHLLSQLAEMELNWSNSFVVLNQGISDLPPDVLTWPSLLASQSSEPIGIAVLIFLYFYCISSSREEVALPLLAPLIQFIKCLHSQSKAGCIAKELSAPLLKALWFSFAISYLSNGCPVNAEIEEASQKLNHLIGDFWVKQKSGHLSSIFTYHPALLLWVFSSPDRNSWLQLHVVLLWLQGCDPSKSCLEMEKLLILNQDAFFCLMEIAEVGSMKVTECALRTLWSCIQKAKPEEVKKISSNIWEILLQMMQRFSGLEDDLQKGRAVNISCMLQLAQASVLSVPSSNVTIRLACLVTSAIACKQSTFPHESLEKNQCILYISGLKMLDFLLESSITREDIRVASSMLSHYGLMKRLEWAASLCSRARTCLADEEKVDGKSNHKFLNDQLCEDLNSLAFLIFEKLLFANSCNSQGGMKSISLNCWHLFKRLTSNNEALCQSSLKFFYALVQVHVMKPSLVSRPLVRVIKNHSQGDCFSDISFVRTLYLQIIMLSATATSVLECFCWEFMSFALKLPNKDLTSHLSKLPWNTSLINSKLHFNLAQITAENQCSSQSCSLSLSFLHFIKEWLGRQRSENEFMSYSLSHQKKIESVKNVGPLILRQTIGKIGRALVNDDCKDSSETNKQTKSSAIKETILMVLKFKREIPEVLCSDLKKKLSQLPS